MPKPKKSKSEPALGYEAQLWQMADALRYNFMDAAEYKRVVLGLIFLKYISEGFEAKHPELTAKHALAKSLVRRGVPRWGGGDGFIAQSLNACEAS
jgi:type I restriction-modification system DNA methylase subunit